MSTTPDEVHSPVDEASEQQTSVSPSSGVSMPEEMNAKESEVQEQDVLTVLAAYEKSLQEELNDIAQRQCATTASHAVKALLEAHEAETRALRREQAALQAQLERSCRLVEQLTAQLAATGTSSTVREEKEAEDEPHLQESNNNNATEGQTSMADLLADYAHAQGRIKLLEAEVEHGQHTLQELNATLKRITEENTQLQHDLVVLRTSCVPREDYESLTRERDEVMQQLRLLQLELPKASHTSSASEITSQQQQQQHEEGKGEAQPEEEQLHEESETQEESDNNEEESNEETDLQTLLAQLTASEPAHIHPTLWQDALRELEAQAQQGVTAHDTAERCARLSEELAKMESEKVELQSALRQLLKEDACVRSDAQSLLFRNGVLSQQLVSLFVKVHSLERQVQQQQKEMPQQRGGNAVPLPVQQQHHQSCIADTTQLRHSLDIVLRNNASTQSAQDANTPTTLELTQGLRRSMELYSRPTRARTVALRSLGCIDVTMSQEETRRTTQVTRECEEVYTPRLPAQNAVHGVALGRPAAYITVDPTTGQRTRHGSSAEYLMDSRLQQQTSKSNNALNSNEGDVRSMLSLIEDGDELDGYSANSIAELIQRNQELLQQVFDLTQQQLTHAHDKSHEAHTITSATEDQGKRERVSSSRSVTSSEHEAARPCKRARREEDEEEEEEVVLCDVDEEDDDIASDIAADESIEEIDVDEDSDAVNEVQHNANVEEEERQASSSSHRSKTSTTSHLSSGSSDLLTSGNEGKETDKGTTTPTAMQMSHSVRQSAHALVEEVVQRHRRQLLLNDETLTSKLLQFLQSYKSHHNAYSSVEEPREAPVLRALVELCAGQAVQLAERAIESARSEQVERVDIRETWAQAQAVLRELTEELRQSLPGLLQAAHSNESNNNNDAGVTNTSVVTNNDTDEERAAVVQELTALLQSAAEREGTMRRVFRTAQARQRAWLRARQRRIARKLRRARQLRATAAAALRLAGQSTSATQVINRPINTTTIQLSPRLRALGSASPDILASPQPYGATTMAVEGSLGRNSHSGLTPPRPLLSLPPTPHPPGLSGTVEKENEEEEGNSQGQRRTSSEHTSTGDDSSSSDSSEDERAEQSAYEAALKERLVHMQTKYRDAMQALSAERDQHVALLERMWQLETEHATAVHEAEELRSRFDRMIDPQTFTDVQNQLIESGAQQTRLQDELHNMRTLRDAALSAQDAASVEWQASRNALELSVQDLQRELHQRRRDYEQLERRNEQLQSHRMHDLDTIHQLEGAAQLHRDELQRMQEALDTMQAQCAAAKQDFLSNDHTQQLLHSLYPNDTALTANVTLVQQLHQSLSELREELDKMEKELRAAQQAQRASEAQVRVATQARQDAEARLQEALQRYDSLANLVGDVTEAQSVSEQDKTESGVNEERTNEGEGGQSGPITDVHVTSLLRRRVQELQAELEMAQGEVDVLQSALTAAATREAELRDALETMSHDPVSAAARRYGLKATHDFEAQLAELHSRNELLSAEKEQQAQCITELQEQVAQQSATLGERADALAALEQLQHTLQEKHDALEAQVAELTEQLKTCNESIEHKEAEYTECEKRVSALDEQVAQLHAQEATLQAQLADCIQARNKFVEDNLALMDKLNALQQDLRQCEEEKRAAQRQYQAALDAAATRQQQQQRQPFQSYFGPHSGPASITGDLSARATRRLNE